MVVGLLIRRVLTNLAFNLFGDTNNSFLIFSQPKCKKFILEKLFPACNLRFLKEWRWLKITAPSENGKGGEPILGIGGKDGRKPYELLLVARYEASIKSQTGTKNEEEEGGVGNDDREEMAQKWNDDLPDSTFASVGLGHSRKPDVVGEF